MGRLQNVYRHSSNPTLTRFISQAIARNIPMWIVGGALRNMLFGVPIQDIDIVMPGDPVQFAQNFIDVPDITIATMHQTADVARITMQGIQYTIDLAQMKGASIHADLLQRDFTMNALAVPLTMELFIALLDGNQKMILENIIDPTGGIDAIHHCTIRHVSPSIFMDDPIRILRAARFAAQLHCGIDGIARDLAIAAVQKIPDCPSSRVISELFMIMSLTHTSQAALEHLDALGVLRILVPELDPCRGQRQGILHYFDVFEHTLAVISELDHVADLLESGLALPPEHIAARRQLTTWKQETPDKSHRQTIAHPDVLVLGDLNQTILTYLRAPLMEGCSRLTMMKMAALFHDIGKPSTKVEYGPGVFTFPKHAEAGVPLTKTVLRRWKMGKSASRYIAAIVRFHMHPGRLASHLLPVNEVRRFFYEAGDVALDVLLFSLADHFAVYGPTLLTAFWPLHYSAVSHLAQQYFASPDEICPPRLISGADIMLRYQLPAGPHLQQYIDYAYDLQLDGTVETREDIWEKLDDFAEQLKQEASQIAQ